MDTKTLINKQLAENPIILYMKGIPDAPECGFSAKVTGILQETKIPFTFVDVLKAPFIREKLPSISKWPTFPQLFIHGELIGGADIVEAMHKEGSLLPKLQAAVQESLSAATCDTGIRGEVETLIATTYPNAQIDIVGEGCDLTITVVSDLFAELPMIKQHQGVMATLSELLASGRLHAVTLKTYTGKQWQALHPSAETGLLQIQL